MTEQNGIQELNWHSLKKAIFSYDNRIRIEGVKAFKAFLQRIKWEEKKQYYIKEAIKNKLVSHLICFLLKNDKYTELKALTLSTLNFILKNGPTKKIQNLILDSKIISNLLFCLNSIHSNIVQKVKKKIVFFLFFSIL